MEIIPPVWKSIYLIAEVHLNWNLKFPRSSNYMTAENRDATYCLPDKQTPILAIRALVSSEIQHGNRKHLQFCLALMSVFKCSNSSSLFCPLASYTTVLSKELRRGKYVLMNHNYSTYNVENDVKSEHKHSIWGTSATCYNFENNLIFYVLVILTVVGIRCADHATPSIRKSWH
jgi:hypothetical protein